ncbi:MAG TPA: hypothetical protein VIM04_02895 [Candidatus Binatia bacterium]|jgi:hypothetical protein
MKPIAITDCGTVRKFEIERDEPSFEAQIEIKRLYRQDANLTRFP